MENPLPEDNRPNSLSIARPDLPLSEHPFHEIGKAWDAARQEATASAEGWIVPNQQAFMDKMMNWPEALGHLALLDYHGRDEIIYRLIGPNLYEQDAVGTNVLDLYDPSILGYIQDWWQGQFDCVCGAFVVTTVRQPDGIIGFAEALRLPLTDDNGKLCRSARVSRRVDTVGAVEEDEQTTIGGQYYRTAGIDLGYGVPALEEKADVHKDTEAPK